MRLRAIAIIIAGLSVASTIVDVSAQGYPGRERSRTAPREKGAERDTKRAPLGATVQSLPTGWPLLGGSVLVRPRDVQGATPARLRDAFHVSGEQRLVTRAGGIAV